MKIYKTQSEVEKDIKNGVLAIEGDVKFECPISIDANIVVKGHITALNIDAGNITALNIDAMNITAGGIDAWNITARNITAGNITARNITAGNILYYAFCCVYQGIKCVSIKATRDIHQPPICLDGKLEIIKKEIETIEIGGIKYSKQEVEEKLKDLKAI